MSTNAGSGPRLEDVDLMLAFGTSSHAGWAKLFVILSHQQPRTESELVAILARKIDTALYRLPEPSLRRPFGDGTPTPGPSYGHQSNLMRATLV